MRQSRPPYASCKNTSTLIPAACQGGKRAAYHGPWVSAAKVYFSRPGCSAHSIGNKLLNGWAIRQGYLETAIKWFNDGEIKEYVSEHQHDATAVELRNYFQSVINWTVAMFTPYRKKMKEVEWGPLYNQFKDEALEEDVARLMMDDNMTSKSGIYSYLLTSEEKRLSIRPVSPAMKRAAFERQKGLCPLCNETIAIGEIEATTSSRG